MTIDSKVSWFKGILLLSLLCCLFLFPTVNDHYIIIEDKLLVEDNPEITSLSSIPSFFSKGMFTQGSEDAGPLYRPIVLASFYINRLFLGHNAFWYHFINLVLHILTSLLIFYLVSQYWGFSYRALIPSALFAVHPVHIDNIGFLINRSDILVLIFLLFAVITLHRNKWWKSYLSFGNTVAASEKGSIPAGIFAGFFFFLALFSKEMAAPALIIFCLFILIKSIKAGKFSIPKPVIFELMVFLFFFTAYFLIRFHAIGEIGGDPAYTIFPKREISSILPTMSRVFSEYIYMLFVPLNLRIDYMDYSISRSLFAREAILSYVVNACIFTFVVWQVRKNPCVSFFILAFYLALLPVSNILPFFDIKAERFLYIPSLFFLLSASYTLKFVNSNERNFRLIILISSVLVVFYGSASLDYSTNLRSEKWFWAEMVRRKPDNPKFQYNQGVIHWKEGKSKEAIQNFEKAIRIDPGYIRAYFPLAASYSTAGQKSVAKEIFQKGLDLAPENATLNKNYAIFLFYNGDPSLAFSYIKRAKELKKDDPDIEKMYIQISKKAKQK